MKTPKRNDVLLAVSLIALGKCIWHSDGVLALVGLVVMVVSVAIPLLPERGTLAEDEVKRIWAELEARGKALDALAIKVGLQPIKRGEK